MGMRKKIRARSASGERLTFYNVDPQIDRYMSSESIALRFAPSSDFLSRTHSSLRSLWARFRRPPLALRTKTKTGAYQLKVAALAWANT